MIRIVVVGFDRNGAYGGNKAGLSGLKKWSPRIMMRTVIKPKRYL